MDTKGRALRAALTFVVVFTASPAFAQFSGGSTVYDKAHNAYFVHGDATLSGDVSDNQIFVGKDNVQNFSTLVTLGLMTLTITKGARTTYNGTHPYGGEYLTGVNVFGWHKVNLSGGEVAEVRGYDFSTVDITGGTVSAAFSMDFGTINIAGGTLVSATSYGSSTTNFSGGTIHDLSDEERSTTNISGGSIYSVNGFNASVTNIRGGSIHIVEDNNASITNVSGGRISAVVLRDSSRLNLIGTGLAQSYRRDRHDFDIFNITGRLQDGTIYTTTKPLQIFFDADKANPTARQFTFNGVVPSGRAR